MPNIEHNEFIEMCKSLLKRHVATHEMTMNQIASIWLGSGNHFNTCKVRDIVLGYSQYFTKIGNYKLKIKWNEIMRDYVGEIRPGATPLLTPNYNEPKSEVEEILAALDDERIEAEKVWKFNPVRVSNFNLITSTPILYCYDCVIVEPDKDEPAPLLEGMKVQVKWSNNTYVKAELLVYEPLKSRMILKFTQSLSGVVGNKAEVRADIAHLIDVYRQYAKAIDYGLCRGLRRGGLALIGENNIYRWDDGLDVHQNEFINASLNNPITFLWGPPGTGKTYTLASLVSDLIVSNKRVLVVAISNAAVDVVAIATLKRLQSHPSGKNIFSKGQLLRFGFAGEDALQYKNLFPHHIIAQTLRQELKKLKEERRKTSVAEVKAELQDNINSIKDKLKEVLKDAINNALAVFTTICQAALSPTIHKSEPYDTVICDEASMTNIVHLLPLGSLARKRLVIAGDPRQLGPVVISSSRFAKKILHPSVFDLREHESITSNPLIMLPVQRRMHESICNLVNNAYYDMKLLTDDNKDHINAPFLLNQNFRVLFIDVKDGIVEKTNRKSRFNKVNAEIVFNLLQYVLNAGFASIGILTPYRAQVSLLKNIYETININVDHKSKVQIGTIHAFQGGERDVIIWDLVDCEPEKPGILYHKESGDRLTNVAISRSKSVLYIIGHFETFRKSERIQKFNSVLLNLKRGGYIIDSDELYS